MNSLEALQTTFPTLDFMTLYQNRNTPIPMTLAAQLVGVSYNSMVSYAKRHHLHRPTYKHRTCISLGDLAVYVALRADREIRGVNMVYRNNVRSANRTRLNQKEEIDDKTETEQRRRTEL